MKSRIEKPLASAPEDYRSPDRVIRVFLADDSPFLLPWLAGIVSKDRRVLIVGSATDGPKTFSNASTLHLDLLVTDLQMPGMDGAEVARRLKQLLNPPTIFVVTGEDTAEARARCLAAGADAFLVKDGGLRPRLLAAIKEHFPEGKNNPSPAPPQLVMANSTFS